MSWPLVKLGSAIDFIRGITFKPTDQVEPFSDGSTVVMRTKNVQSSGLQQDDLIAVSLKFVKRQEQFLQDGDILISSANSWELVGKVSFVQHLDYTATAGGFISIVRAKKEVIFPRYLHHWLSNPKTQHAIRYLGRQTTNISNLDVNRFKELRIPLPPLPEQKRIVAILDKADQLRQKRQQAINMADEFLRSVFLEMFGDPVTNPKGWEVRSLGEVSTRVTKGESPKWQGFAYQEQGIRFVTSENVLWGKMDMRYKYIAEEFHQKLKRSALVENDMLINLVGASVGRACIAEKWTLPANINQAVAVVSLNSLYVLPEFLLHLVLTSSIQGKLLGNVVEAARANISLKNIRELEIIIPPILEQEKFLQIVERQRGYLKQQDDFLNTPFADSLSQKAFAGQL